VIGWRQGVTEVVPEFKEISFQLLKERLPMIRLPAWPGNKRRWRAALLISGLALALVLWGSHLLVQYVLSAWDRNRLEQIISSDLKRQVSLGSIDWHVGLQGLIFSTDRMSIEDKTSGPLLRVGKTRINFAIVPLLKGELLPKRIELSEPEFWAERIADSAWNFSDLSQIPAFYHLLHAKIIGGKLHVIDRRSQTASHYRHTEFDHVNFELNRPFGKLLWPFALSFDILQPEGDCSVKLNGIGNGSIDEWRQDHYFFELKTSNLDPMRLTSVLPSFPEIIGLVDLELKGSGVPSEGFRGSLKLKANRLMITPPGLGPIRIADASSSAEVNLSKVQISWQGLKLKLGNEELRSDGKLDQWLSAQPTYEARLSGHFDELGKLLKHIDSEWVSTGLRSFPKNLSFDGVLDCRGSISAAPNHQEYTALVTMTNGVIKLEGTPFAASSVNGLINFDQVGLSVKSLKGRIGKGQFQASGRLVPEKTVNLLVEGKQVQTEDLRTLLEGLKLQSPLLAVPMHGDLEQLNATVDGSTTNPKITYIIQPREVIIEGKQHEEKVRVRSGILDYDGNRLKLGRVIGTIGQGEFEVSGFTGSDTRAPVDLGLKGQNLDLTKTVAAAQAAGFNSSILSSQVIAGKVKTAQAHLSGPVNNPKVVFSAQPQELLYQPADPNHAVRLSAGDVFFDGDSLKIKDVAVTSGKSNFTLGLKMANMNGTPQLKHLKLDNARVDLGEIFTNFTGKGNPEQLQKFFADFQKQSQTSNWQGQVSGNFAFDAVADGFKTKADGSIQSVQFQRSGKTIVLANGTLSTNTDGDVCLKDLSGSVGRTTFTANGCVRNLARENATISQMQIDARVVPQDVTALFNGDQSNLQLKSNRPIKTTLSINSEGDVTHASFAADLDPESLFLLKCGDNKFRKPQHQALSISGTASSQGSTLTIGTSKAVVGPLAFQFSGSVVEAPNTVPQMDLKLWIHDPVPIGNVVSLEVGPLADIIGEDGSGQVRGGMHMFGPADNLALKGKCHIIACSLPKLGLADASGVMQFKTAEQKDTKETDVTLNLDSARLQSLPVADVEAQAVISEQGGQSTVRFDKITGKIAKAVLTASGSLDLFANQHFTLTTALTGLDTSDAFESAGIKKGEITGNANMELNLTGDLQPPDARIKSLSGSGQFSAQHGRIAKLSQLQIKIEQGNILESGILGFNIANVLSTTDPLENGEFLSANGRFRIINGVVQFDELFFNGEEMKLSATGQADLAQGKLKFHTIGEIPRVVTQGGVGKVASLISFSGIHEFVAAPFSTPKIPVVGSVSSKPMRRFEFDVDGTLDHPESIDQSIRKSFKWVTSEKPTKGK
jgi:hypothetical protein